MARQRAIDPRHEIVVQLDESPDHLPGDVSIHLLRIVGEALTNARRHAGARRVELRVAMRDEALIASVTGDGHGIAPDAVPGHGIAGMRERAELLGGELAVTERPGGGTVVELRAPLFERPQAAGRARILLVDDHAAIRRRWRWRWRSATTAGSSWRRRPEPSPRRDMPWRASTWRSSTSSCRTATAVT